MASFSFAFKRRDGVVLIRCKLNDHEMSNRPRSTHDVNQDYLVGIPKAFRFLWVMGMGKMATPQNLAQHHQCLRWSIHWSRNHASAKGEESRGLQCVSIHWRKSKSKNTYQLHNHDRENPFVYIKDIRLHHVHSANWMSASCLQAYFATQSSCNQLGPTDLATPPWP